MATLSTKRLFCRTPLVWDNYLKERLIKSFQEKSIVDTKTNQTLLPVARFVSTLYELNVLNRAVWPTSRIVEEMHSRGYAADIFTKPSYGAEPPPRLTLDECIKWTAFYRVIAMNGGG